MANSSRRHIYLLGDTVGKNRCERDNKVDFFFFVEDVGGCGGQGQERATERCARFSGCVSLTSGQAAVGATQIDAAV